MTILMPDAPARVRPADSRSQRQPTGPRGGAYRNLVSPGTVTFFLAAPGKHSVHVIGDFNRWDPAATPMRDDGSGIFRVTIPLTGPTHYRFAVDLGGSQVWVADPYAREIRWDTLGPKAFLADERAYEWRSTRWQKPALRDLVIYELCVRDFGGQKSAHRNRYGTFRNIAEKLDHLQALGVSAIELMPITEFPGDSSWGYNPVFYMAPKAVYGRPHDFKALIDACHERGIVVILDMVFNHAWPDQPYHRMYPPLFGPKGEMLEDHNPFFHHHNNGHANAWGGLDWEHSSPWVVGYMQDIVRFWLNEYHVDGFRFDWLGGVEYDPWQPQRENFDPFSGIAPIARSARETCPDCYLIGEYWPIHGTNPNKTAARLVRETEIDAVWNGAFHHGVEACLFETWQWERHIMPEVLGGFFRQGFERADQVVNYVVSHDERRVENELQHWAPHVWDHVTRSSRSLAARYPTRYDVALQKARLGATVLLTSPGVPMLLAGQEWGDDTPRTIDFSPLTWSRLQTERGRDQFEYFSRLIALHGTHPALRADFVEYYLDDFERHKVVRYKRWDGAGDVVVVAANFDSVDHRVGLGFPQDGLWQDAVTGRRFEVTGHWREFVVPAWSAIVVVNGGTA